MNKNQYLVLQINMDIRPSNGAGVLSPVVCDGHYTREADAQEVAAHMAAQRPKLRTCVVRICAAMA